MQWLLEMTCLTALPFWATYLKLPPQETWPQEQVSDWHDLYPELHGFYEDVRVTRPIRIFWMAQDDKKVVCRTGGPGEATGPYKMPPGAEECYPAGILLDLEDPQTQVALRARGWAPADELEIKAVMDAFARTRG